MLRLIFLLLVAFHLEIEGLCVLFCDPPTPRPTARPTRAPTDPPTFAPTEPPTFDPTEPPTFAPTFAPTKPPTFAPTFAPTKPPTLAPTLGPTNPPTRGPTTPPSLSPTKLPTTQPPTKTPTTSPTFPTSQPSRLQTNSPTIVYEDVCTGDDALLAGNFTGFMERSASCASDCETVLSQDEATVKSCAQSCPAFDAFTSNCVDCVAFFMMCEKRKCRNECQLKWSSSECYACVSTSTCRTSLVTCSGMTRLGDSTTPTATGQVAVIIGSSVGGVGIALFSLAAVMVVVSRRKRNQLPEKWSNFQDEMPPAWNYPHNGIPPQNNWNQNTMLQSWNPNNEIPTPQSWIPKTEIPIPQSWSPQNEVHIPITESLQEEDIPPPPSPPASPDLDRPKLFLNPKAQAEFHTISNSGHDFHLDEDPSRPTSMFELRNPMREGASSIDGTSLPHDSFDFGKRLKTRFAYKRDDLSIAKGATLIIKEKIGNFFLVLDESDSTGKFALVPIDIFERDIHV